MSALRQGQGGGGSQLSGGSVVGPPGGNQGTPGMPVPNPSQPPALYTRLANVICHPATQALLRAFDNEVAKSIATAVGTACALRSLGSVDWAAICSRIAALPDDAWGKGVGATLLTRLKSLCGDGAKQLPPAQLSRTLAVVNKMVDKATDGDPAYDIAFNAIQYTAVQRAIGGLLPTVDDDPYNNWLSWMMAATATVDIPEKDRMDWLTTGFGLTAQEVADATKGQQTDEWLDDLFADLPWLQEQV